MQRSGGGRMGQLGKPFGYCFDGLCLTTSRLGGCLFGSRLGKAFGCLYGSRLGNPLGFCPIEHPWQREFLARQDQVRVRSYRVLVANVGSLDLG